MLWLLLSLLGGLSKSLIDTLMKKFMKHENEHVMVWGKFAFSLPFFLIALLVVGIPKINSNMSWILLIGFPLELLGMFLYFRAIKISPLGMTIPFLGLTPVFLLLSGFLILKEIPSFLGLLGILAIVFGIYLLGVKKPKNIFDPIKNISKEKGSVIMIFVAALFSITPIMWKLGAQNSSVFFYGICVQLGISIFYTIMLLKKNLKINFKKNFWKFLLIGFISMIEGVTVIMAMDYVIVNYAMSVKRVSILFSTIFGYLFFAEKDITKKIISAIMVLLGIFFITLA